MKALLCLLLDYFALKEQFFNAEETVEGTEPGIFALWG